MTRYVAPAPTPSPSEGLPPLPPMYGAELWCGNQDTYAYKRGPLHKHHGGTPLYTKEQMWAYARAASSAAVSGVPPVSQASDGAQK